MMSSYEQGVREQAAQNLLCASVEFQEFNLVALLKPRIFIDGNQWYVLWGENLQDGIAGFGDSPILAVYDFSKAWHRRLPEAGEANNG